MPKAKTFQCGPILFKWRNYMRYWTADIDFMFCKDLKLNVDYTGFWISKDSSFLWNWEKEPCDDRKYLHIDRDHPPDFNDMVAFLKAFEEHCVKKAKELNKELMFYSAICDSDSGLLVDLGIEEN